MQYHDLKFFLHLVLAGQTRFPSYIIGDAQSVAIQKKNHITLMHIDTKMGSATTKFARTREFLCLMKSIILIV